MKCLNLARTVVENSGKLFEYIDPAELDKWVFICINNPGEHKTRLPYNHKERLDLFFYDFTNGYNDAGKPMRIPEPVDASMIVDFIVKHEGKNICVHCTAGVSRSGAVCDFLINTLGYECPTSHWIHPNTLLLELMEKMYKRRIDKKNKT